MNVHVARSLYLQYRGTKCLSLVFIIRPIIIIFIAFKLYITTWTRQSSHKDFTKRLQLKFKLQKSPIHKYD